MTQRHFLELLVDALYCTDVSISGFHSLGICLARVARLYRIFKVAAQAGRWARALGRSGDAPCRISADQSQEHLCEAEAVSRGTCNAGF